MTEQVRERKKRIGILLILMVVGGLLWFGKFGTDMKRSDEPRSSSFAVTSATPEQSKPQIISGPDPDTFDVLTLPRTRELVREVVCGDEFYTVLLFPVGADYREAPRSAVYNSASPCVKGETIEIKLSPPSFTAPPGSYYLIIADQGATGLWYNAR